MIIITGGIGCGKSVVCQLLQVMGHTVYDCDREAKRLMTSDPLLRRQLQELFGPETYLTDGSLNKPYLSAQIFNDASLLQQMNALIHPAVARDIERKKEKGKGENCQRSKEKGQMTKVKGQRSKVNCQLFVETAIHFESGFDKLIQADQVWCVASPLELRIERAMTRDHATREKIQARINNQMSQEEKISRSDAVIWNDNTHSLIEQINNLIK